MVYNICIYIYIYIANTTYINAATGILVCYPLCMQQLPTLGTPPKQVGNLTGSGDHPHFQGIPCLYLVL